MKPQGPKKNSLSVLRLESSPRDTDIIRSLLTEVGYDVTIDCATRKSDFASLLRSRRYDVILSDYNCPGFDAFEALKYSIDICPHVPFVCVSDSVSPDTALELTKGGAVDNDPQARMVGLLLTIDRALTKVKESTSRQIAEQTLRQSEERYHALVTFSPDALYVHVESQITFANPEFCRLLGADHPSQIVGKSIFTILPPEYHQRARERLTMTSGGQPVPFLEEKLVRLDGTVVAVEVNAVAIDWQGSRGFQVVARDITARKRTEDALRESESRFKNIFDRSVIAKSIITPGGGLEVNDAFCALVGYSREELSQMNWRQLTHPDELDRDQQILNSIFSGERDPARWQKRFIHKQGNIIWADVGTALQRGSEGKPGYLITSANDITEAKNTADELHRTEERFRKIFEESQIGIVTSGSDYRFQKCNPAFCRMTGYTESELTSMTFADITFPEDLGKDIENIEKVGLGQIAFYKTEKRYLRKNGEIVWGDIVLSSVHEDDGTLLYYLGMIVDITERKTAEKLQSLLSTALESTANGVVITDLKGNIVWTNKAFVVLTGYTQKEALGKNSRFLQSGKQDDSFYKTLWETISAGGVWHGDLINKKKDGSEYFEEMTITPLKSASGEIESFIAIKRDITARKLAQEALSQSEQRFHQLFDDAPVGYHELDMQGRIVQVNLTELKMLDYQEKEMLGHKPWDFIVERQASRDATQRMLKGSVQTSNVERTFRKKDGTPLKVLITNRTLLNEAGRMVGIRSTLLDNTERTRSAEAEKDSEERFRMVFENVFDGISIYSEDPDPSKRRLFECNNRYAAMAGRSREELLRIGNTQGFQVTLDDTANSNRLESPGGETAYKGTFSWIRPDGKDNVVEYVGMPITWRGKPYSIVIDRDVTQRKKAERELRLLAQTVASAQDCISITDLKNKLLFVNDAFQESYGYTSEELLGKDVSVLRSPLMSTATTDQIFGSTLAGGWHGEVINRRKDGSDFPVELWTSTVKDEAGTPVAMVGIARDITGRKTADEALTHSEEQFRLIAENVADMIAVVDLDGRRLYNSPSYKAILGDPESLKGTDGFQEIHPNDVDKVRKVFRDTVRTGIGQRIEYRFLRNDGTERIIDSKGSVIRDGEGKTIRVVIVSRDVTEEKRLQAQFLRSQRMESIGILAGGIAHDLNNVLAPIMMAIDVLRSKVSDPSGQNILSTIETSAKRGADIVRQVLAFGRGLKGDRTLVQLKHVINEVVKICGETFPKSIEVRTDIPRDLWTVLADPTQMHQVLLNMLLNARDAMPSGGTIKVSTENVNLDENYSRMHLEAKPGAYVSIVITDTGTGIPLDVREKIFEPFFTTKEIGKGTGLGLSTTLSIIKSHAGFIDLESEEGRGTTFKIYIPATGTVSDVAAPTEGVDIPMGNGELILVIDDEAAIREITQETLKANGYRTMIARDGAEGVALFAENKKDITAVITDIMMPVMDGTAAIIVLQKIDPNVKIIAASGLATQEQITTPSNSSVKAFLTKPYTAENLLKVLAEVIR